METRNEFPARVTKELIDKATQHFPKPQGGSKAPAKRGERGVGHQLLKALVATLAHIGAAIQNEPTPAEDASSEAEASQQGQPAFLSFSHGKFLS